jgi:hypothetical protein
MLASVANRLRFVPLELELPLAHRRCRLVLATILSALDRDPAYSWHTRIVRGTG